MNIYISKAELKQKNEVEVFKKLVNFLENRGHNVLGKENFFLKTTNISPQTDFEQRLRLIKQSDIYISISFPFSFDSGFELNYCLNKAHKRCIVFYPKKEEKRLPRLLLGCTFSNFYLKAYSSFTDLKNTLTLFQL